LPPPRALPPELLDVEAGGALVQALGAFVQHAPLGATPIAGPCSLMNCGDIAHRRRGRGVGCGLP
jgi:hypothetical protein